MPHSVVIFGASGDLTNRKLIPALYELFRKKRLPATTNIVGVSRSEYTDEGWRQQLEQTLKKYLPRQFDQSIWSEFAPRIHYVRGDVTDDQSFPRLAQRLHELEGGQPSTRIYYLSTMPSLYAPTTAQLGAAGLADDSTGARRIVIEKPIGTDLATARKLNEQVHQVFREDQIYRIDHYLGKETVQNLLVLRFANSIFEPVWNRNFIDHVQITVAEEVGVGSRAPYYDAAGILRDMFQNHLLQLMMITAMEAPARYEPDLVRNEKVKVLQAIRPLLGERIVQDTVAGQYEDYRQEKGVPAESRAATFGAIKLHIDNWRWQGVPFYLRSGKRMSCRTTQIVIQFRQPPHILFGERDHAAIDANRLIVQIQPNEGIQLHFLTKVPDAGMRLRMTDLDFRFGTQFNQEIPDSYQRLLLDAIQGDASLFAREDEVEVAWKIVDPLIAAWDSLDGPPVHPYPAGEWGPVESGEWMRREGRDWFDVCPVLH